MRVEVKSARNPVRPLARIFPTIFAVAVLLALWIGWASRDDNGLTPVSGAGYWLGIAGSVLILAVLLYPLRKRLRSLRAIGSVTLWSNTHMILGVLGPVMIMWHANFRLGSVNCSVALIIMLAVAISGVFGRYLHSKINSSFHERKTQAQEVVADADELRGFLGSGAEIADRMVAQLNAYALLGTASRGALIGIILLPFINWRGAIIRMRLIAHARGVIAIEGRRHGRPQRVQRQQLTGVTEFVTQHIAAARNAAAFSTYERLFRLWHIFHLPLFILLVLVAIVHVYASHFF
jgi:ABC-type multidrug transport system fused ATPase/permease subunit